MNYELWTLSFLEWAVNFIDFCSFSIFKCFTFHCYSLCCELLNFLRKSPVTSTNLFLYINSYNFCIIAFYIYFFPVGAVRTFTEKHPAYFPPSLPPWSRAGDEASVLGTTPESRLGQVKQREEELMEGSTWEVSALGPSSFLWALHRCLQLPSPVVEGCPKRHQLHPTLTLVLLAVLVQRPRGSSLCQKAIEAWKDTVTKKFPSPLYIECWCLKISVVFL